MGDIEFMRPQNIKMTDNDRLASDTVGKPSENHRIPSDCTDQEKTVFEFLLDNQTIKSKQVEELLSIKESRTRELLQNMAEKKYIVKLGKGRSTFYKLVKVVGDE